MNYTPRYLFQLSQIIPEVRHFLKLWEHGRLDWNTCLLELHKALVQRCFEFNKKWEIGLEISEQLFAISELGNHQSFAQAAVHNYCNIKQQENVIQAIHVVANIYHILLDEAKRKSKNCVLVRICQYNDGHADFEYSDGTVNSHDLSHLKLSIEAGECGEPQELGISGLPNLR